MDKSLLSFFLDKVANGEKGYEENLCRQLADRLVYVPILAEETFDSAGSSGGVKVEVLRLKDGDFTLVPVFSTDFRFTEWAQKNNHSSGSICLLAGDLCRTLGPEAWVVVDTGYPTSVKLEPRLVKRVSEVAEKEPVAEEDGFSRPKGATPRDPAGEVREGDFQPEVEDTMAMPMDKLEAAVAAVHPENKAKDGFVIPPRAAHHTVQVASPFNKKGNNFGKAEEDKPAGQKKKRRSFLSFLKSGK